MSFREADWKRLRRLKPLALERLCSRMLKEFVTVVSSDTGSAHERYLKLYELVQQRDRELASTFNDMRRTTAHYILVDFCRMGLLTDEEFDEFSPETRQAVLRALDYDC